MIKKHKKMIIITTILCLLPIIVGLIMWNQLPEQMVTHFNFEGQADGWSPKPFAVLGLPGIICAVHLMCVFITGMDSMERNIGDKMYAIVLWICPIISMFVSVMIYSSYIGVQVDVLLVVNIMMALMLLIIGNYMPKCRQNHVVGIKISWTLEDEDNWNKTHHFAGWLWMIAGVILLVNCFFLNMIVLLVILAVITIVPIIYSGLYHAKKKKDTAANK